jgi:hypothetical protein
MDHSRAARASDRQPGSVAEGRATPSASKGSFRSRWRWNAQGEFQHIAVNGPLEMRLVRHQLDHRGR